MTGRNRFTLGIPCQGCSRFKSRPQTFSRIYRHVTGDTDAIAQVAQGQVCARWWWAGRSRHQRREGAAQGFVHEGIGGGVDADDVGAVLEDAVEGFGLGRGGFGLTGVGKGIPGAAIDLDLVKGGLGVLVSVAAAHLRRQVMAVGVEIALGT